MGHVAAFFTILIWGTTFISTKILLRSLYPIEILFLRFLLGYAVLWMVCPHFLRVREKRQERLFAAAGLCGITLYYLLENIALTDTLASNVGIILSTAPFFTALLEHMLYREEKPSKRFWAGFLIAMFGIGLLSFGGNSLQIHPLGDGLAMLAAAVWAAYSLLTRKISSLGYPVIQTTRRTFFYGLCGMAPLYMCGRQGRVAERVMTPGNGFHLLFLGICASAICFVTWSLAVKRLGAVRTSAYIYMVPMITVVAAALFLGEVITARSICGIVLTLAGLLLSEGIGSGI